MNDAVVVDASLALKWVLDEPDSVAAVKLLNSASALNRPLCS